MRVVMVLLFAVVVGSLGGCAALRAAAPPHVTVWVRSVRDEDTGVETSEWQVEAQGAGPASRVWLARPDGASVELVRERGRFRAGRRSTGEGWLDGGGVQLVVAGATGDDPAVDDAVLARDEGLDEDDEDLVSTPVDLPAPPPRPALEGLHAGPAGPGVRWSAAGAGPRAWFDLIVSDLLTGGTVFRSLGAGQLEPGAGTLDEPIPAGLLQPDRSYVVEVRARSELGLVAVERATRRTLRLP